MLTLTQPPKHLYTQTHTHANTVISVKGLETDTENCKYCKNYLHLQHRLVVLFRSQGYIWKVIITYLSAHQD